MEYLLSLFSIVMINILLSGDNALVIALASRKLPAKQQKAAMLWGSVGAIVLRIVLTIIAIVVLKIPYLQMIGGFLLLWIAIKLVADKREPENIEAKTNLSDAIKTIVAADVVMSLDNILAIAGIAQGNTSLLIVGLIISMPIIIWGSKLIGFLMKKWPVIITIGSVFLGWTAGEMVVSDHQIIQMLLSYSWIQVLTPYIFGAIVLVIGKLLSNKKNKNKKES